MAVGTTTTTNIRKQYWHNYFISNLYDYLTFHDIAKRAPVPAGNGTVVWWSGLSKVNPAGASLTEGADPTARSSAASRVSGTLAEYGNLIKNATLFMDTALPGVREGIMKDLAKDGALTLDNVVRDRAIAGGTALYANAKVHRSDTVEASTATIKDIRKGVRLMQISSVPAFAGGDFAGLIHPDVVFDLQSDSAWTDFVKYRDTVKWDLAGEVGRIYGVRFKIAPTIPILTNSGSANVDVYRTMIVGEDYVGLSELGKLRIVMNEPGAGSELGTFNTYGYVFVASCERLSNQKAVRLESSSSF